jgi:hypothetical protein
MVNHKSNLILMLFSKLAIIFTIAFLLLVSAGNLGNQQVLAQTAPSEIQYFVPITLTNNQQAATTIPFQQKLTIDSATYNSYESSDLKNVEFFYSNGAVVPSWLESGNSNTASNTVYWLRLDGGIAAGSSVTVYMGFASLSTNFFSSQVTGEAPQLSPSYAQHDDGANVFSFYENFAGSTLSNQWVVNLGGGSYQVNNGLRINYVNLSPGYLASSPKFGPGTVFDASITSIGDVNNIGYFDLQETLPAQPGGPGYAGAFIRLAGGHTYPDQWNSSNGEANPVGDVNGYLSNSVGVSGIYSVAVLSSTSSTQSLNNQLGTSTQPITGSYPSYPASVGFAASNNGINVQWARVRALPPNGVMPTMEVGSVTTVGGSSPNNNNQNNNNQYGLVAIVGVAVVAIAGFLVFRMRKRKETKPEGPKPKAVNRVEPIPDAKTPIPDAETANKLEKLKSLLEKGLISQEDYDKRKKKLILPE